MAKDNDWYGLGWDGYNINDDIDFDHHKSTEVDFKEYSTHKGFTKKINSYEFEPKARSVVQPVVTSSTQNSVKNFMTDYNFRYKPPVSSPTDTSDSNILSIVIMQQDVLNALATHCRITAGESEFQVHYRALIVKLKKGIGTVYISIPTAFYNFKQSVAHSSVDYELTDVDVSAELVISKSLAKVQELLDKVQVLSVLKEAGYDEFDIYESNSGSMHRHPGRFGFSSIDYRKDPKNPGVVYRQGNCKNHLQTDSVLYLATTGCEVYTTESRIINVAPSEDGGIEGTYCRVPTLTFLLDTSTDAKLDVFSNILGTTSTVAGYEVIKCSSAKKAKTNYELLQYILESFKQSDYLPDTSGVDNTKITSAYSSYGTYGMYGMHRNLLDDSDVDDYRTNSRVRTISNVKDLPSVSKKEQTSTYKENHKVNTEAEETKTISRYGNSTSNGTQSSKIVKKSVFGVDLSAWEKYLLNKG